MKKICSLLFAVVLTMGLLAGCASGNNTSSAVDKVPVLSDIHAAVKEAYGDNYLPSRTIENQELSEVYGLTTDNIEEVIAEGPTISAHVDQFIAIKAKEGKGADVEKELNAYRDKLVSDTMQYPMNLPKIQSSQVTRHGDYVFFTMLGAINDNVDATEEEAATFAKDEAKKATDAIEKIFNR